MDEDGESRLMCSLAAGAMSGQVKGTHSLKEGHVPNKLPPPGTSDVADRLNTYPISNAKSAPAIAKQFTAFQGMNERWSCKGTWPCRLYFGGYSWAFLMRHEKETKLEFR